MICENRRVESGLKATHDFEGLEGDRMRLFLRKIEQQSLENFEIKFEIKNGKINECHEAK